MTLMFRLSNINHNGITPTVGEKVMAYRIFLAPRTEGLPGGRIVIPGNGLLAVESDQSPRLSRGHQR